MRKLSALTATERVAHLQGNDANEIDRASDANGANGANRANRANETNAAKGPHDSNDANAHAHTWRSPRRPYASQASTTPARARRPSAAHSRGVQKHQKAAQHQTAQKAAQHQTAQTSPTTRPRGTRSRAGKLLKAMILWFGAMALLPAGLATMMHHRGKSTPVVARWISSADSHTTIKVLRMEDGTTISLPLNDYIENVLAAELDWTAPAAALKAAAVACRTYAVYSMTRSDGATPTIAHQHKADLTDSPTLDLPWLTVADQAARFGKDQALASARIQQAVHATDGQILTYKGQPILAFTTALSPGRTRDASKVFGKSLPYLVSVDCPDDRGAAGLNRSITFAKSTLAHALQLPAATLDLNEVNVDATDNLGFVQVVGYREKAWTGDDFATLLHLPSSDFGLRVSGGRLVADVIGIGSGLGMSLHEAEVLASRGTSWTAILHKFYPGTSLTRVNQ